MEKIKLKDVKVIFANLEDEGFGRSITIDATDENTQKQISEWVKANKIGKGEKAGVANFKEYQPEDGGKVIQFSFRLNEHTQFVGFHGLDKGNLGYGATVSLIANAFEYNNKFGTGIGASLSAVLITKGSSTAADSDVAELIGDHGGEPEKLPKPEDNLPTDAEVMGGETVDLSDIPF